MITNMPAPDHLDELLCHLQCFSEDQRKKDRSDSEPDTVGPFIGGKIRRELDHLYEHVLSKTKTARINGSRLISVLDSFSCE